MISAAARASRATCDKDKITASGKNDYKLVNAKLPIASGRFREGNYRKNIRSEYCRLLYPFRPLLILRDAHEQLIGHMRMSLYTSRGRERQCSLIAMRSQNGRNPRVPTELYFHQGSLKNVTFGVLGRLRVTYNQRAAR